MTRRLLTIAAALVASLGWAQGAPAKKAVRPPAATAGDHSFQTPAFGAPPMPEPDKLEDDASIVVTIRHTNGELEKFSKQLDSMDLIFEPSGKLVTVHLIMISGAEKDTHRWYQIANLTYFGYRFLNLAGKGKVRLKVLQPFTQDKEDPKDPVMPAVQPKDYR